jgi:hypothetical protein
MKDKDAPVSTEQSTEAAPIDSSRTETPLETAQKGIAMMTAPGWGETPAPMPESDAQLILKLLAECDAADGALGFVGACGRCGEMSRMYRNPYGGIARCYGCRLLDVLEAKAQ